MKELRLIEMMGNIDEELLIRANAPVPLFGKPRFRNAFIASAVAVLLVVTMIASPVAVAVSYGNAHPEIEGGLVYVMDAMIKDENHFLSSLLPESAKNTLGTVFDALKGEKGEDERDTDIETETEPETETETETEIEKETEPEFVMPPASEGLEFRRNETNDGYKLIGIGSCTDADIVIPAEYNGLPVTEIYYSYDKKGAFEGNTQITSVIIPGSVKSIGDRSFYGCTALQKVYIEQGSLQVIDYAFENCNALQSFTVPDTITCFPSISIQESGLTKYDNAYYLGNPGNPYLVLLRATDTAITSCEIHPDTKIIARSAFSNCESLQGIDIPEGVISIGSMAFAYTKNLSSLTLPQSLRFVENTAFSKCKICIEYENATYIGTESNPYAILLGGEYLKAIHEDTEYIVNGAFSNATAHLSNKGFTIPENVRYIGKNAFAINNLLGSAIFDDAALTILGDDCYIAQRAFQNVNYCNLVIGKGVTHIEQGAFWTTGPYLQSITVEADNPSYVAVGNCLIDSSTQTLLLACTGSVVPNDQSIKHIGANAFCMNDKIDGTVIPDGVISIGARAFLSYSDIDHVPASVKIIGENAFGSGAVYYDGTMEEWNNIAHPNAAFTIVYCKDGEIVIEDD